jgi:hypothetical protein
VPVQTLSQSPQSKMITKEEAIARATAQLAKPRGCEDCQYLASDSEEWRPPYYYCTKRRGMDNLKSFPFRNAPKCFTLNFWCSPFADMIDDCNIDESLRTATTAMDEWENARTTSTV